MLPQLSRSCGVESVWSLFKDAMNVSDSFVGSRSPKSVELFHQARLVRITNGAFAIWLDPFGMLDPQVVMNLLLELAVGVDLMRHGNGLIQVWRGTSTSVGDVNVRRDRVRVFQKAARTRSPCTRRRADWIAL